MKQTLFTKQLAEYFNIYLPINKKCSKNTISSYADGFVALFRFFKEIKGIPHYRINYSDITTKTMDEYLLWLQNEKNYSAGFPKTTHIGIIFIFEICFRQGDGPPRCLQCSFPDTDPESSQDGFPVFFCGRDPYFIEHS